MVLFIIVLVNFPPLKFYICYKSRISNYDILTVDFWVKHEIS